ncbi:MAG: T9SS type A sorting domain-containing protein [Flavobacteriales bacterium]|nr:T9SS type A sorting domain-containing protein [Flavobacteriales bacterium]
MKSTLAFLLCSGIVLRSAAQPGALDLNFDADGIFTMDLGDGVNEDFSDIAVQSDGKIVAVGGTDEDGHHGLIIRFLPDGNFDPGFGTGGIVRTTPFDGNGGRLSYVRIQSDGKILTTGWLAGLDGVVLRFLPNGTLDPGFGLGGIKRLSTSKLTCGAGRIDLTLDGRIVVTSVGGTGGLYDQIVTRRLFVDGSDDTSFSFDGLAQTALGINHQGGGLAVDGTGRVIVSGGFRTSGGRETSFVLRYLENGLLDPDFAVNGVDTFSMSPVWHEFESARSALVLPSGSILLAGSCVLDGNQAGFLRRIHADGTIDPAFGTAGIVHTQQYYVSSLVTQADGRIVVGGANYSRACVGRYLQNGQVDGTFGEEGVASLLELSDNSAAAYAIALQSDHNILLAGSFSGAGTDYNLFIARLLNDEDIGIPEFTAASNTLIYPNPITERAEFTFALEQEERLTAEILDAHGKLVHTLFTNRSFASGSHRIPVGLGDLAEGSYRLVLSNGSGKQAIQLVKK